MLPRHVSRGPWLTHTLCKFQQIESSIESGLIDSNNQSVQPTDNVLFITMDRSIIYMIDVL